MMFFFLGTVLVFSAQARDSSEGLYGFSTGYLESTEGERESESKEMMIFEDVEEEDEPLIDLTFSSKVEREIKQKYEREFGRTNVERNTTAPLRFADLDYINGARLTHEEDLRRQREFGEYMVRKLVEYRMDRYFNANPRVKPIYELKEKVSNVNIKSKGGYQFKVGYSYAGNHLKLQVVNPYKIKNRLILQMNPGSVVSADIRGYVIYLGYDLDKKKSLESYYNSIKRSYKLVSRYKFSSSLITSLSLISENYGHKWQRGKSREVERKVLFGISWDY